MESASKNYVVPDFAIVPRFEIKSFFVIPIPVSVITIISSSGLTSILILSSVSVPNISGSCKD